MIRGWYIGASGMNTQQAKLDVISNNLANVDTTGYKKDTAVSKSFSELLIRRTDVDGVYKTSVGSADAAPIVGKLGLGVETNEVFTDFTQGSYKVTENQTDVALSTEGFFTVMTPQGERYTRNGNFMIGKEKFLETKEGYPVMGEHGPIQIGENAFTVNEDGLLYNQDTMAEIDRFKIVQFDDSRYLTKQGSSLYSATNFSGDAYIAEGNDRPLTMQGYVETSNVNVVNEMIQMIEVNRAYEANQKSITTQEDYMSNLWSKVATMR